MDGFASELDHIFSSGDAGSIATSVMGCFVMEDGKANTMKLYDAARKVYHEMSNVSLLWRVGSPLEGKKKFPRPFIFTKKNPTDAVATQLKSPGEKLLIQYVNGNIYNPIVVGAVESLSVIDQKAFLRIDPNNLDRQVERYETDDYVLESENDGSGNITLTITGKTTGNGNFTVNLSGQNAGNISVNANGTYSLIQNDGKGNTMRSLAIDLNKGLTVLGKGGILDNAVYGKVLIAKLTALINAILQLATTDGSMISPSTQAPLQQLQTTLNDILVV
jgi:hypothetical protein